MKTIKKYRNVILRIVDIFIIVIAYYIAEVLIDNTFFIPKELNRCIIYTICLSILCYSGFLHIFKTYKNITRYETGNDYLVYVLACFIAFFVITTIKFIFKLPMVGFRTNTIAALIIVITVIGYRVVLRLILTECFKNKEEKIENNGMKNVLVIGAGDATRILLRTLKTNMKGTYNVVGLVDDNVNKVNYAISGTKILGTRYDIPKICKEYQVEAILFTISNITNEARKEILKICQETGCKVRILPGTAELIKNKNLMDSFRDVEIEDLLGRDTIKLDNKNIGELIKNKVVLVTGRRRIYRIRIM